MACCCVDVMLGSGRSESIVVMFAAASAFVFATFAATTANIVLVGAAVAFHAIVEVTDAFLDVLAADLAQAVLVATVAGVALVVVTHVTGDAAVVVIAVEHEVLVVVEGGRRPLGLAVALAAVAVDLLVQIVLGDW